MSAQLNIFFIIISTVTLIYIIMQIRRHKLNIDDSILWIFWSIVLLIVSIFPDLSFYIAEKMGFQSTSNFILCLFIFILYMILFFQNIKISELRDKNKQLVQKVSIYAYKQKNNKLTEKGNADESEKDTKESDI